MIKSKFEIIENLVNIFINNDKVKYYILNKFKEKYGLETTAEFDPVGEHHWNLSKVNLDNNDCIGYMPGAVYYGNIVQLDEKQFKIVNIPKNSSLFFRERDQASCYKKLVKLVYTANNFLDKNKHVFL